MIVSNVKLFAGCWSEIGRASWVWRTLNPASTLHTMAENPALEWNARQEQPSEPSVALTPILAHCSLHSKEKLNILVEYGTILQCTAKKNYTFVNFRTILQCTAKEKMA